MSREVKQNRKARFARGEVLKYISVSEVHRPFWG